MKKLESQRALLTAPRQIERTDKIRKCIKPARVEERPTGRIRRVEVKPLGGDWTVEERAEMEQVAVPAEYREDEVRRTVWVVETIPLSTKKLLTTLPEDWPEPEVHEFATQQAADEFYRARMKTNPDIPGMALRAQKGGK